MENQEAINIAFQHICNHYAPLEKDCMEEAKRAVEVLTPVKNTLLVKEGQMAGKTYYIVKGSARTFYLKDGKDITDWFAFEHDFISPITSYFLSIPSTLNLEVLEDSVLVAFNRELAEYLSGKYHSFERLGSRVVTKSLLQMQQRMVSIQFESAWQRYENLLRVQPDITLRVPLSHIASYLGITFETLSRIRNPKNRI
ncbi:MAG: Crp/Fnr family transcriptional regulator [Sediminibacterium sp.]|nr:Crp/Fnr family transcriptional regulator [Sediminibacterium sp.]